MAIQWMPLLIRHAAQQPSDRTTAADMVALASQPATAACRVAFVHRATPYHPHVDVITCNTVVPSVVSTPISADNSLPARAVARWAEDDLLLPVTWQTALTEALRYYPTGHSISTVVTSTGRDMTHTWIVDVSRLDSSASALRRSVLSEPLTWTPARDALPHAGASAAEISAFRVLLRHESPGGRPTDLPDQPFPVAGVELPETRFPWIHEPSASLPPPPPARHVRYRRGRWQAWMSNPSASRGYGWSPLPTPLSHQLWTRPFALPPRSLLPYSSHRSCPPIRSWPNARTRQPRMARAAAVNS